MQLENKPSQIIKNISFTQLPYWIERGRGGGGNPRFTDSLEGPKIRVKQSALNHSVTSSSHQPRPRQQSQYPASRSGFSCIKSFSLYRFLSRQLASQLCSQSVRQSVSQPVSQPVSRSISQSVSVSVSQPVSQPVSQLVSQSVCQSVSHIGIFWTKWAWK